MLLALLLVGSAQAQHRHQHASADSTAMQGMMTLMHNGAMHNGTMQQGTIPGEMLGMMNGRMMQMMNDPVQNSAMLVYVLPTMSKSLSLSERQLETLKQQQRSFLDNWKEGEDALAGKQAALERMIASAAPEPDKLEKQLVDIATEKARLQAAAIETTLAMKSELTPDQRDRLGAMTPETIGRHMTTNLSMANMAQMMNMMGSCPMELSKDAHLIESARRQLHAHPAKGSH